jgi:hypothetical protein
MTDKASSRNRFGWLSEEHDLGVEEAPQEEAPARGAPVTGVPDLPVRVPGVAQRRRRNRPKSPKALRNDPRRMMAGARIRKDVRRRVDQALADPSVSREGKVNYSLLVEGLLVRWLEEVGYALADED